MSSLIDTGRRSLLSGRRPSLRPSLLPPWAVNDSEFYAACTRCHACMDTCPEHILTLASGGFPTPNFSLGECTFCEECAQACPTNALQVKTRATSPWQQAPVMNEQCLAKRGVVCRSCGDSCPREAIEFNLARAHPALATPQINNNACTGCGACISVCPNQALTMQIHPHPEEVQPT